MSAWTMEPGQAREAIINLLSTVKHSDKKQFLYLIKSTVTEMLEKLQEQDNATVILDSIREDIRNSLPVEALTRTETIVCPEMGPNSDCDPRTTVHVDAFLYDDDAVDDLCDQGKMSRNYCTECMSRAIKPLTFISHSASIEHIKFIYKDLLKDLRGKMVLDVGSRTGALLYGAYLYSEADSIVGVELDPSFCELQNSVVAKYSFGHRIKIVQGDILQQKDLLQYSDVIILNNVFEFFIPPEQQINIWQYLHQNARKKNAVLITTPSIEESLSNLEASLDLSSWLKPLDISSLKETASLQYFSNVDESDLMDIFMYQII